MKIQNVTFLSNPEFNFSEIEIGDRIVFDEYLGSLYLVEYVEFKCHPFVSEFIDMKDDFDKVRTVLTKDFLKNVIAKIDSGKFKWLGPVNRGFTFEEVLRYSELEMLLMDADGRPIAPVKFPLDSVKLTPYLVARVLHGMMRDEYYLDDILMKMDSWNALPKLRKVIEEML